MWAAPGEAAHVLGWERRTTRDAVPSVVLAPSRGGCSCRARYIATVQSEEDTHFCARTSTRAVCRCSQGRSVRPMCCPRRLMILYETRRPRRRARRTRLLGRGRESAPHEPTPHLRLRRRPEPSRVRPTSGTSTTHEGPAFWGRPFTTSLEFQAITAGTRRSAIRRRRRGSSHRPQPPRSRPSRRRCSGARASRAL